MAKQAILLFYLCDEWKGKLKLRCAATAPTHIRKVVERELHDKAIVYGNEEMSVIEQIREFRKDWRGLTNDGRTLFDFRRINDKLVYGFLNYTHSGETL